MLDEGCEENLCVKVFTPKAVSQTTDVRLKGVVMDSEGNILVGDRARKVINIQMHPGGKEVKEIRCGEPYVGGIAVNSQKQIIYCSHEIGTVYSKVVAIDYSGDEVFSFTPRIDEDVTGKLWTTGIVSSKIWEEIDGIVCDEFDNIYLAMSVIGIDNTGHIHKYNSRGKFLHCVARGLYDPCDVAIARDDGALVVANDRSILFYK